MNAMEELPTQQQQQQQVSAQKPTPRSDPLTSDSLAPSSPSPKKTDPSVDIRSQNDVPETSVQSQAPQMTVLDANSAPVPLTPTNSRLAALQAKRFSLEAKLADLQSHRTALASQTKLPSGLAMPDEWSAEKKQEQAMATANGTIKEHIALLHKYNEIKDIGQGLIGLVAEQRKVQIKEIMEEFGMDEKD